jgi:3-hydroxyisobutyrate dehydrogenase-like beta-hydroxyacid dehydrogenase
MGAMGSRMAVSLLKAGHSVTVWNRTADRTKPLVEQGASAATSPREAARGADFVLSVVRDNEASRRVWLAPEDGALEAMTARAIGIESSTLTPNWVRELASAFAARGVPFLDAPVVGTRAQADAVTLIHLVGGEAATMARAQPLLSAIGNAAHHVGAPGSGAALKLLVNALLTIQVATMGELLGAAEQLGLDRRRAGEVIVELPTCSASAKGATMAMLAKNFAPAFPVELAEKDLSYLAAAAPGDTMPISAAARRVFERALEAGLAGENMTAVAKLYG